MIPDETCAVCGRNVLAGERTRTYMAPTEGARKVCDLCRGKAAQLGWVDPAAPGANVRRRVEDGAADSPGGRLERAVAVFNESESARTVAGLMRTLGPPWVSVGSAAGAPGEMRVTVAWELCWYQWGVDLADDARRVFALDKGDEIERLDRAARQWNATAGEGGRIALGAPAGSRAPRDGEPVG